MDIVRSEMVEAELDSMIRRRDTQRRETEGHRPSEEMYEEGCRRHAEAQQQALAWEWLRFHSRQLRNHETTSALITSHHRQEIAKYEAMLGINYEGGDAA